MNRMSRKLTGVGIALVFILIGTTVNAQNDLAVTDSMLLGDPEESWLHTNGNLAGHRYSVLTQLNPSNADQLNIAWIFWPGGETDAQMTPLYHDGLVYFAQDNKVFAIDARSGSRVWKFEHELPETFGGYNVDFITGKHRGVAILGNHVYFLSNDAKLHALHYRTGELLFTKQYLDYPEDFEKTEDGDSTGYATTIGPTAIPGQILVPLNGTDFGGLPGWVYGVNPADGEILWECNMIPGPGEPGYESWPGDSAEYGGAGPWITGAWDPELKLYYTGTANAYPWNPKTRGDGKMDNLGAASVVACNTDTGKAAWRYVVVPGDPWDYDTMQTPMVITIDGRKTVVHPNKTGYIHYLDAATGEFLRAPAFADRINWIEGYDVEGRPVGQLELPVEDGDAVEVWPSLFGGVNMYPNAYNPVTGNLHLVAENLGMGYLGDNCVDVKEMRNVSQFGASWEYMGGCAGVWMMAVDVKSGHKAWSQPGIAAGMLTTAGNLVFYTSQAGVFHATNATTGEILYTKDLGITPKAGPITYMLDGKQYVVQPVGGVPGWGFEEHRLDHGSIVVALSR